ncbi:MAG TPA: PRC-barrel domain-containing protein [Bradyrhizobium sp.]|nr:PRC-barrel domain-containing protein [Bradyrhizobium sp.]
MVTYTKIRTDSASGVASSVSAHSPLAGSGRALTIWAAIAVAIAAGPALSQAGVALVKVDVNVVEHGYRLSKLIGSNISNDKNQKIGSLDDVIADKNNKQVTFAVLQVGGFLGIGGRLVAVPFDSLVIDDNGTKLTLPGASKDELEKLSAFHYQSS